MSLAIKDPESLSYLFLDVSILVDVLPNEWKRRKKIGGGAEEIEGGLSGVLGCIIILRKICSLTSIVVIITIFLRSLAVARPAAVSIGSDRSRPSAQIFEETDDSSLDPRQPVHSPVAAN